MRARQGFKVADQLPPYTRKQLRLLAVHLRTGEQLERSFQEFARCIAEVTTPAAEALELALRKLGGVVTVTAPREQGRSWAAQRTHHRGGQR